MKVKLVPHTGANIATGRVQELKQYKVLVDGNLVGFKSWDVGSPVCFCGTVSPIIKDLVLRGVNDILNDEARGVEPPEYDPSKDEKLEQEYDDFDESDPFRKA